VSTPIVTGLRCPACGEGCGSTDRFCESCGAPLTDTGIVPAPAARAAAAAAPVPVTPCPCGDGVADADGYCESCGRLVPAPSDHAETDLGPAGALVTDRGLRHSRNEDAGCLVTGAGDAVIAAVADGVSTSDDPQNASAAAAQAAADVLARAADVGDGTLLECVHAAADAVAAVTDPHLLDADGNPQPTASVPACTLVACHVAGGQVSIVSVGDSRAYWIPSDGPGEQVSIEDSWAADVIADGMDPDQAYADRRAHEITAWLGLDSGPLTPHLTRLRVETPGVLLLCSDGLWNYAPAAEDLTRIVRDHLAAANGSPVAAASSLVEFARAAGGADNITVALLPVDASPPDRQGAAR